jgi:hypothetical protein
LLPDREQQGERIAGLSFRICAGRNRRILATVAVAGGLEEEKLRCPWIWSWCLQLGRSRKIRGRKRCCYWFTLDEVEEQGGNFDLLADGNQERNRDVLVFARWK